MIGYSHQGEGMEGGVVPTLYIPLGTTPLGTTPLARELG